MHIHIYSHTHTTVAYTPIQRPPHINSLYTKPQRTGLNITPVAFIFVVRSFDSDNPRVIHCVQHNS